MLKRFVVLAAAISLVALPVSSAGAAPSKNIVETAAGAPQFSTLVSLVKKAGLVGRPLGQDELHRLRPHQRRL